VEVAMKTEERQKGEEIIEQILELSSVSQLFMGACIIAGFAADSLPENRPTFLMDIFSVISDMSKTCYDEKKEKEKSGKNEL